MSDIVPTKAALLKGNVGKDFKVITFTSHKAKPKVEKKTIESVDKKEDKRKGIDIQRARREIIKFGISGFAHQKQQEAKIALAVSLGAKPPKNPQKNYKELLEQKKRQKRLDKKYEQMHLGKSSHSVGVSKQKIVFKNNLTSTNDEKRKKKDDLLKIYGTPTLNINSTAKFNNKKHTMKKKSR